MCSAAGTPLFPLGQFYFPRGIETQISSVGCPLIRSQLSSETKLSTNSFQDCEHTLIFRVVGTWSSSRSARVQLANADIYRARIGLFPPPSLSAVVAQGRWVRQCSPARRMFLPIVI